MLHLNTIDDFTHTLLLSLCAKDYLSNFALVGGTNLSLRFGHRKSIDIDFFSVSPFLPVQIEELLSRDFTDYIYRGSNKYMLFCNIGNVKTDIVHHPFALLAPLEATEGIRMFSVQDVAAMKLFAICKRGTRKDFYDVWVLLKYFSKDELMALFIKKYGEDKVIFLEKSILYFEDADESEQPEILIEDLSWEKVKEDIYNLFK
ncbi:MAG: nucleotidyl transferase AbiEii/AbiGii toxin family protein [Niabella sp.]